MQPAERLHKSLTVDNLWQYILKSLKKPMYAYELTRVLKQFNVNMVTVYAVLYKLESGGYVRKTFSKKYGGPARKYYAITPKGADELSAGRKILEKHAEYLSK